MKCHKTPKETPKALYKKGDIVLDCSTKNKREVFEIITEIGEKKLEKYLYCAMNQHSYKDFSALYEDSFQLIMRKII